ncbi:MAG: pilus assembly FimT family protein [Akkermansiaceae bacterium]
MSNIGGVATFEAHAARRKVANKITKARGFTLVEVLVVMAIIATLLGLGVGAIKSMASSKGVSTAVPLADSIFSQARQIAKSTGLPARVVIYADSAGGDVAEKRERHLRMMGVATGRTASGLAPEDGEAITQWKLVSRPTTLPSKTYFNANLSNKSGSATESVVFPGSTTARSCYVYEFNSEGALVEPTDDGSGASISDGQFVVQVGKLNPGADNPSEDANARRDAGGFRIWANGRMAKFRSVDQIMEGSGGSGDPTF